MKYWSVWCKGLRSISGRAASMPPILRELQTREEQLGMSWQDVVRLLGMLSAPCEFLDNDWNEETGSFHTNTGTMSSMGYFRDPKGTWVWNVEQLSSWQESEHNDRKNDSPWVFTEHESKLVSHFVSCHPLCFPAGLSLCLPLLSPTLSALVSKFVFYFFSQLVSHCGSCFVIHFSHFVS